MVKSLILQTLLLGSALSLSLAQVPMPRPQTTLDYITAKDSLVPIIKIRFDKLGPRNFGFDTGASMPIFSRGLADQLGLTPKLLFTKDGKPRKLTSGEQMSGMTAEWYFNELLAENEVLVMETERLPNLREIPYDGIIGNTAVGNCSILADPVTKHIILLYGSDLSDKELAELKMDKADVMKQAKNDLWIVPVSVRLNNTLSTDIALDTGGDTTILPPTVAKKLKLKSTGTESIPSLFGDLKLKKAKLKTLQIGSTVLKDIDVLYADKEIPGVPFHIGMDVLSKFRLLIDYPEGKVYFKPLPDTVTSKP